MRIERSLLCSRAAMSAMVWWEALAVRPSARFRYDEDVRYYANGFRVARDLN
jgi:formylglycine-generating enzyme required for sulfatase activity